MSQRRGVMIGVVLAAAIVLPACDTSKTTDNKPAGNAGKSYDSPQAVFDAGKDAAAKEDWGTFMTCLTDDSQNTFTFMIAFSAMFVKGFAEMDKDKGKDTAKAIDDAMAKHGFTEKDFENLEKEKKPATPAEEKEAMRKLVAPIKDKAAFVGDVMAAMKKFGKKNQEEAIGGELKDLKVEGDKATATLVRKKGGKDTQEPIEFRKIGGGWRIELPDKPMGAGLGGPPK